MSDTFISVIAVGLSAILMFVFPVMAIADRVDKVSQIDTETMTSDFINEIKSTGKLTLDEYNEFITNLTSDGNLYDIELEFRILDENPGKKALQAAKDKIGENIYYSVFTTQIEEALNSPQKVYELKEGDIAIVTVRNTNITLAQQIRDSVYTAVGSDIYTIRTTQSALVTANGSSIE